MSWGKLGQLSSRYLLPLTHYNPTAVTPSCSTDDTLSEVSDNVPSDIPTKNQPPIIRTPHKSRNPEITIHHLPNELLLGITDNLTSQDLYNLIQCSRRLHSAITPTLHSRAVTSYSLTWAARRGHESLVKVLLDRGVPVESRLNPYGKTAIHYAACEGRERIVSLLLDRGANINSQGATKQTALHLAALNGYEGIVRMLLDRGADVTIRDSAGHTALLLAVRYSSSVKTDVISRLLIEGRKGCCGYIDAQDNTSGRTVRHWAAMKGMEETVRLLTEY